MLILYTIDKQPGLNITALRFIMYKLTRELPDLQNVFPFYWDVEGPVSWPLNWCLDRMIYNELIGSDWRHNYNERFEGNEIAC
jgi:hypothetical protein